MGLLEQRSVSLLKVSSHTSDHSTAFFLFEFSYCEEVSWSGDLGIFIDKSPIMVAKAKETSYISHIYGFGSVYDFPLVSLYPPIGNDVS